MYKEDFTYCDEVTVVEESKAAFVNRHVQRIMSIRTIEDAVVFPFSLKTQDYQGEVFVNNERISEVNSETIYNEILIKEQLPSEEEFEEEAIYIGSQNMCWGHYFTDGISKMWCLQSPIFQSLINRSVPIYFSSNWMSVDSMPIAWKHLIDLLGGEGLIIRPLKRITRFGKLYVPTNCIFNTERGRFFTDEYLNLIITIKDKALSLQKGGKSFDKIYLTRTRLTSDHGEFGERSIESAFQKCGFQVVCPEQLSFEQQVWLLWNAQEVAGTMGSISHNFVFCRPETKAIIIRKVFYTNDFQYVLNQVAQLDVTYIDAHLSVFVTPDVIDGPFFLYRNGNITRYLLDTFDLTIKQGFKLRLFKKYAMMCFRRPDFYNRNQAPNYYYQKMYEELRNNRNFLRSVYHKIISVPVFANLRSVVHRITR